MKKLWSLVPAFAIFIALSIVGFFGGIVLLLSGERAWLPLFFFVLLFLFFIFLLSKRIGDAKKWKQTGAVFGVLAIMLAIWPLYQAYLDSIPSVSAEVDIYSYMPFQEDSKLNVLDEEPELRFEGDLPRLDGATALYPIYAAAAEMMYPEDWYEPSDSEVMVNTTPFAYSNLFEGEVDAIFAAAPSQGQLKTADAKGLKLTLTPIGKEAFVFFVHADNPVESLSSEDLRMIYSGEITDWSSVGGEAEEIRAFQRPEDSGSQTALLQFMGDVPVMKAPRENIEEGMGGIIDQVAEYKNHKNALGFTFRFYGEEMAGNEVIRYLAIDGIVPSVNAVRYDEYPLTSEFYIVTTQHSSPEALKLAQWFTSAQGQRLVEKAGYVPLNSSRE